MNNFEEKQGITGKFDFITSTQKAADAMQAALKVSRENFIAVRDALIASGDAELATYHNLVVNGGKALVAKAITQDLASVSECKITHQELGTGATAPSYTDTGLQTPSGATRKAITSIGRAANVVSVTSFWAVGEATGTWAEFALFIAGTMTSNSGTLWNRVAVSQVVAADKALTIDGTITFT